MSDKKTINKILKEIKILLDKSPSLRLCQLLGNCFSQRDLYHVEDEVLLERLEQYDKE